ncbi:DUF1275 family protein [Actinomyces minihominis]|uniref:DUF1275 family protein n=1 Tax=Actinomyces minihominis TaxID=2002838 RepID=UPI000C086A71|nr:YoaK family protein [Actinomyces minihominis]
MTKADAGSEATHRVKAVLPQGTSLVKVMAKSMHPSSFPLMELPHIALILAISSGLLNSWAFSNAGTFGTAQSGNVIQMGYQAMAGNWPKFFFVSGAVLAFGVGAFVAGGIIAVCLRSGKRYTPALQGLLMFAIGIALVLIVTKALRPEYITWIISFAAGVQGNGFHKIKGMVYGNVAVNVVLQLAFNYLMQSFFSKKAPNGMSNLYTSGLYFMVLVGFGAGGGIGFLADHLWNGLSVVLVLLVSALLIFLAREDPTDPDPKV